ncbi:cytochrome P450 4c3 isoform X2 [Leptinotarsa decemlineata]|uniref:cytochrome P450 4c3 isoform X2 n=1 Tax=Leptinotarsa decemlineata TaxID=7539 RepID=UPI003D30A35E
MMFLLWELFILVMVFLSFPVVYHYSKRNSKYLRNLPGPKPNMFVGNWIDFFGTTEEFLSTLMLYLKKYGPHIKVYNGPISTAVVSADEKFIEFFLSSPKLIDKADEYSFLHNWLGLGLLTSTGLKWKKRRKMLTPAFHFSILESFVDVFESVGDIFMKKLEEHVGKASFDIYPLVSLCTLDIICEAAMGVSINAQENSHSEYVRSVKEICAIVISRIFSPLDPRLYPLTWTSIREKIAVKKLHAHTNFIIERRMKEVAVNGIDDGIDDVGRKKKLAFLDMLLKSSVDGQSLSMADIREEVDTFMFEGHDTTSSAISFAIYCLAAHPEVQKKALEEQKHLFGNLKEVRPKAQDLNNMKYLELVIKEVLRLYPSVPFLGRKIPEDFEWGGTIYPKGVNILLLIFASHRSPNYFPEPLKFIPERFENYDEKRPYLYVPFSAGPRNCIGQKFAMLEMKSTISKVLRHFEILPATPEHKLKLAPETILVSKNGVCISLRKRFELE